MEMEEDVPVEELTPPPAVPVPWYERPLWLGVVGLLLMVGGYKLSTFVPERDVHPVIGDLKERGADDPEYQERLRPYHGKPPYQLPGWLIVFAGLLVFLYAGARMAGGRDHSPQPPRPLGEGE